jgi:cytochrome c551/c552
MLLSSSIINDPDPLTRLAGLVKLAEFPASKQIETVAAGILRNPANQEDEWLREACRILGKVHGAGLYREGPNLLPNPGFEVIGADGQPEGWKSRDAAQTAQWTVTKAEKQFHGGQQAMRVSSADVSESGLTTQVSLKPNTRYRLAGWVKTATLQGRIVIGDLAEKIETESIRRGGTDWTEVEVDFNSGSRTVANISLLLLARGEAFFDDVRLTELTMVEENPVVAGDAKRGEQIFLKHPAACVLCHSLRGQGGTVGPALDGIATRGTEAYIRDSLLEPSKVIAKGFEQYTISPMPPVTAAFTPQEQADILAFVLTLK